MATEVMNTFLDASRRQGEPEPPPDQPREWIIWCRDVGAKGRVLKTWLHEISGKNLADAKKKLRAFLRGKKVVGEEW